MTIPHPWDIPEPGSDEEPAWQEFWTAGIYSPDSDAPEGSDPDSTNPEDLTGTNDSGDEQPR